MVKRTPKVLHVLSVYWAYRLLIGWRLSVACFPLKSPDVAVISFSKLN